MVRHNNAIASVFESQLCVLYMLNALEDDGTIPVLA